MKQRSKGLAFEATISLLDFVTIGLASALLLFVMVRDRKDSAAAQASSREALVLVRAHFAERSAARLIALEGNFFLGRPASRPVAALAPAVLQGKDVTALPISSRVRRVEILVQAGFPVADYPKSVRVLAKSLLSRGIRYGNVQGFGSAIASPPHPVVSDGDPYWPALSRALTTAAVAGGPSLQLALDRAIDRSETSATPLEPIIVFLDFPEPDGACGHTKRALQLLVSGFGVLPRRSRARTGDLVDSVSRLLSTCGGDAARINS